jgi:hypothetical protein
MRMERVSLMEAAARIGRTYHQVHRATVRHHRIPYRREGYWFSIDARDLETLKTAIDEITASHPRWQKQPEPMVVDVVPTVVEPTVDERLERIERVLLGFAQAFGQVSERVG